MLTLREMWAHREVFPRAGLCALAIWVIYYWAQTVNNLAAYFTSLPEYDYWITVLYLPRYFRLDWSVFWQQHSEHRIVFPQIIFALDYFLFRGREILPVVCSLLFWIAILGVFAWFFYAQKQISATVRSYVILIAALIMGWPGIATDFASPFLVNLPLSQFADVLALAGLPFVRHHRRSAEFLGLTIISGVISTYSCGSGMLVWPILILAGYILRLPLRQTGYLFLSGTVSITLYFVGYTNTNSHPLERLIHYPFQIFGFVASYLSMPFGALGRTSGLLLGMLNLVVFIILIAIARRKKLLDQPPAVVFLGNSATAILTALVVACGRMNPADLQFSSAKVERYMSVPLANWVSLLFALFWLAGVLDSRLFYGKGLIVALLLILSFSFSKLHQWTNSHCDGFRRFRLATISVTAGLRDWNHLGMLNQRALAQIKLLPVLEQRGYSIYATPFPFWIGKQASSLFSIASTQTVEAGITYTFPVESGVGVVGWVEGPLHSWNPDRIVFVNQAGIIVGYGEKMAAGLPFEFRRVNTPSSLAWVGFVNSNFESHSVKVYRVNRAHGILEPLGALDLAELNRHEALPASDSQAGDLLDLKIEHMDKTWTVDGPLPAPQSRTPAGTTFESWSGSDSNTGSASAEVSSPTGCIILPVVHGPLVHGISLAVLDAKTKQMIASVPMRTSDVEWRFWKITSKASSGFEISAADNGNGWGQWIAFAQPHACK